MDDQSWPSHVILHKIVEIQLFLGQKNPQMFGDLFSALVAFWIPCMNSPLPPHF
jgi:hypothetical protein